MAIAAKGLARLFSIAIQPVATPLHNDNIMTNAASCAPLQ